jgi:hypothetical protein
MAYTLEILKAYTVRGKDCSDDLGKQNFYKVTVSQDLQLKLFLVNLFYHLKAYENI